MLEKIDLAIFFFINNIISNPVFDFIMPLFDEPKTWISFILIFWLLLAYKDKKNRKILLIMVPMIILFCDQIGGLIKDLELRDRPWFGLGLENVRHLGGFGGKHSSFPSNHAANISGIAFLFSSLYPKFKVYFWSYALIVMISRVYIGVHYPFDVFFGFILGISISFILIKLYKRINEFMLKR
jgi:undecaprenyl-diphosphatase